MIRSGRVAAAGRSGVLSERFRYEASEWYTNSG
jgi:hypothetical protein